MEQHERVLKVRFSNEHDDSVIRRLKDLAQDVNARSLEVFQKAEEVARDTSDMELFLRSREIYEKNKCVTKRIKKFRDQS
jgi:hypothetical protein